MTGFPWPLLLHEVQLVWMSSPLASYSTHCRCASPFRGPRLVRQQTARDLGLASTVKHHRQIDSGKHHALPILLPDALYLLHHTLFSRVMREMPSPSCFQCLHHCKVVEFDGSCHLNQSLLRFGSVPRHSGDDHRLEKWHTQRKRSENGDLTCNTGNSGDFFDPGVVGFSCVPAGPDSHASATSQHSQLTES